MGLPCCAEGGLEIFCEAWAVHQGGILQAVAEGGSEGLALEGIGGECGGNGNIFRHGLGDEFLEADLRKQAHADAGAVRITCEGDHGNAHPEGLAGGGGAVVGEGVEGDIDGGILGEVRLGACAPVEDVDAGGIHGAGGKLKTKRLGDQRRGKSERF